ncbi:MAG: Stk1 family PASTA domain-containing Ser/Thr kinase [Desulfotomaculales bacterium]
MLGRILGNRYEIIEELGGGGMALVYKGRDRFLNRLVTIKILRPEFTADKDFIACFQREAQAIARLSHPNIVSIYDVGQEDSIYFLVMEYVHGDNLKAIVKKEGPLAPEKAVRIALQICEALAHAHENNIIHRDVKPHNILVTSGGWAKLTDFGIAREMTAATFTFTGTVMGSVHYLSPEQARGQAVGPRSDLYSLGVVLYEMLTGTVPYQGDSPIAIALKHIQEQPEPPSRLNPRVSPQLEKIVFKAMNKDSGLRFASAREMQAALQGLAAGQAEEGGYFFPGEDELTRVLPPLDEDTLGTLPESRKEGRKKKRIKPLGWVALVILLLAFLATGAYGFSKFFFQVPEIQVPDVRLKSLDEAKEILKNLGLQVAVQEEYNQQVPEGYVIDQDIGPDDPKVRPSRVITLKVSRGPDWREVPDLYQATLQEARIRLAEAGLEMAGEIKEDYNEKVPAGYIFSQEPPAGSRQPKGTAVTVYVSRGQQPVQVQVPDLTGLSIDQARARLTEKKLRLDENISWTESGQFLQGQVISQDPPAGAQAQEDAVVKVTVSKGPGPAPRKAEIRVTIPEDGQSHQLKINVTDVKGSRDVYVKTHSPGDRVAEVVEFYGKTTIRVYLDNKLVSTKTYS